MIVGMVMVIGRIDGGCGCNNDGNDGVGRWWMVDDGGGDDGGWW